MSRAVMVTMMLLGVAACAVEDGESGEEQEKAARGELGKEEPGEPGGPTAQSVNRRQCGAQSASLRSSPGGTTIAQVWYNEIVDVWSTDGVWHYVWHFGTNQWGYTLAQYYCPVF